MALRTRSPTSALPDARVAPRQPPPPDVVLRQRSRPVVVAVRDAMVRVLGWLHAVDQVELLTADDELAEAVAMEVILRFGALVRAHERTDDGARYIPRLEEAHDTDSWEGKASWALLQLKRLPSRDQLAAKLRHVVLEAMGDATEVATFYTALQLTAPGCWTWAGTPKRLRWSPSEPWTAFAGVAVTLRTDHFIAWIGGLLDVPSIAETASWTSRYCHPPWCCHVAALDAHRTLRFICVRLSTQSGRMLGVSPTSATEHAHEACFRMLMHLNMDVRDSVLAEQLYIAAGCGHASMCRFLLGLGATCNNAYGCNAVAFAATRGHDSVVKVLLEAGAPVTGGHILSACLYSGNVDVVRLLLDAGADVNARGIDASTPLHHAALSLKCAMVEYLVSRGADVNALDCSRNTPFLAAMEFCPYGRDAAAECEPRLLHILRFLCSVGADMTLVDVPGCNIAFAAAAFGFESVLRYFHELGLAVNKADALGHTPFFAACSCGHDGVVQFLLELGADVNEPNPNGVTPLIAAITAGYESTVRLLHNAGADLRQHHGWRTPLQVASRRGHETIVAYLKSML